MCQFKEGDKVQFRSYSYGDVTEEEMKNYYFSDRVFTVLGGLEGNILKIGNKRIRILLDNGDTADLMIANAPYILKKKNIVPDEYFVI